MAPAERAVAVNTPALLWSSGAPQPLLVATDQQALFAFVADHPLDAGGLVQTAEFVNCVAVRFGFPNDEALPGHPLWDAGLDGYGAYEILESRWLTELRAVEATHENAPATPFGSHHHFMLIFHDSMLEAIAREITVGKRFDTLTAAATHMLDRLDTT